MQFGILRYDLLLLLAAAIWGGGFVAQRTGMESVGPFTFNAVRFALGGLSLVPLMLVMRGRRRDSGTGAKPGSLKATLYMGSAAGVALFTGAAFQQSGLVYTTAGKAAFITGTYVIIVQILGVFRGHRPDTGTVAGAVLAVTGLYFLSVTGDFRLGPGDTLVLIGAFFWACHLLLIGKLSPRMDPFVLSFLQFMVCSALSLAAALWMEPIELSGIRSATLPILYGGLGSVGMAFTLQVIAQRHAHPAHAAVILSMEAVFAAFYGWLLLDEQLTARALGGCGLMFIGALLAQVSAFFTQRTRLRPYPPKVAVTRLSHRS